MWEAFSSIDFPFCCCCEGDHKVEVSAQGLPEMNGDARLASEQQTSTSDSPGSLINALQKPSAKI